ncbi:MAG: outer membrane lipoprotein carrier protein LolA [Clostridiales bacterium]|nr:outer membrane lipoprotein carrier protein LolA [Clostridiales bacterium]
MLKGYRMALVLGLILCIIMFTACREKTPEEVFITAQNALNSLKSYSATITYKVIDGQEEREYRFKQWVSMPSCFKIQLIEQNNNIGKTIVSDGRNMVIKNPEIGDSLKLDVGTLEQQRPLFIGDFLRSYWMAENVDKRIHVDEGVEYVIFTCPLPSPNLSVGSQELWLRSPKMVPAMMITYDYSNQISSIILFEEFDSNWQEDQDFFNTED